MVLDVDVQGRRASGVHQEQTEPGERAGPGDTGTGAPGQAAVVEPALVGWVVVEPRDRRAKLAAGDVSAYLLRRLQGALRDGDWLCPAAPRTVAVVFGPGASTASPASLGRRLVQGIGDRMVVGQSRHLLRVAVGISASSAQLAPAELASMAASAQRAARLHLGSDPTDSVVGAVTCERLLDTKAPRTLDAAPPSLDADPGPALPVASPPSAPAPRPAKPRRKPSAPDAVVLPTPPLPPFGGVGVLPPLRRRLLDLYHPSALGGPGVPAASLGPGSDTDVARLLVIDPRTGRGGEPGLAALAVASMAERHGYTTTATTLTRDGRLRAAARGTGANVVVIVLPGATAAEPAPGGDEAWALPASLAEAFGAGGATVVAVDAGAGLPALAGCVEHGATPIFDLDQLGEELEALHPSGPLDDARPAGQSAARFPEHFAALSQLTTSERRVLHRLMTGASAQEIALQLVVSVTTVRSHIRSILRKLNVKSQLAAVAIANGSASASPEAAGRP